MGSFSITESRPSATLAALHAAAAGEREYLYAGRRAQPDDVILVAWMGDEAAGYLAASDEGPSGLLIWEHLVVPHHRGQGIGVRLLHEAARRVRLETPLVIDPMDELDPESTAAYYRRLGFQRTGSRTALSAPASVVLRAVRRRLGVRPESETPVRRVIDGKMPGVVVTDPAATLREAISLMNRHRIGAVVVSSDGRRVEGILSERDALVALDRHGPAALGMTVTSVCTLDVVTATTADSVADVMDAMTMRRIRHLPVTNDGALVGIVSVGDLVLHRLLEMDLDGGPAGAAGGAWTGAVASSSPGL